MVDLNGPDAVAKTIRDLEQEITCGICHDHYEEPKVFPCCHYYCKQCIAKLASRYPPNQPFPCPDCREPTLLPDSDPDKLPTAFFINRMKTLHSRMEKASGKVQALCEMCSGGDKSVAFCRQCAQFICAECVKTHKRVKVYAGHKIATSEELKQTGPILFHQEETLPTKCTTHDEPKKLYCSDCSKLICRDCTIIDHTGHKYEFVKTAAPETRKKLTAQAAPLKEITSHLQKTIDEVTTARNAVEANRKFMANKINSYFDELKKVLDKWRQELLDESSKIIQGKVENLTAQEKNTGLSLATVQSLTDFVERTLANGSDEEVVAMQTQVLSRIKGEIEKHKQRIITQKPVKEPVFGVKLSLLEELRKLCTTKLKILAKFNLFECTVESSGVRLAEIDKPECVVVSTHLPAEDLKVRGELKSLVDGSAQSLQASHCQTDSTKYTLVYTPKVRGRHQLSITLNGDHILGSPFPVFVRTPPTKLGKVVRVVDNIVGANYVAFTSSKEMIITRYSRGVDILDKNRFKVGHIGSEECEVNKAEGVAVDEDDNIYLTDREGHCLVKFNRKMQLVKKLEGRVGSVEMGRLMGVAVHNERVLVCDNGNSRVIVLNRDLEFVREFGSEGAGPGQFVSLQDIATDEQGNIYASDRGNHRVQVFSNEGEHVCMLGNSVLKAPRGLCVDNCYVYIVDKYRKSVVVYTTKGQYVTSFGELPGDLYGIAMDSDGFPFVCCYSSNKIIVF